MLLILIVAVTILSATALVASLFAVRYARNSKLESRQAKDEAHQSHVHMDAHMRALDVLTDPDLNTAPSEDHGPPSTIRRGNLRLLAVTVATPGAIDWLFKQTRAHRASAASFVTLAAAVGYVALTWPQHPPEPSMSMDLPQPPPIVSTTVIVLTPAPPAGGSAQAAPPASVPVTSGASMTSISAATLVAGPTAPARTAVPSSSGQPAVPSTSAPSVPTTTQPRLVPACALAVETDVVKPCAIVK